MDDDGPDIELIAVHDTYTGAAKSRPGSGNRQSRWVRGGLWAVALVVVGVVVGAALMSGGDSDGEPPVIEAAVPQPAPAATTVPASPSTESVATAIVVPTPSSATVVTLPAPHVGDGEAAAGDEGFGLVGTVMTWTGEELFIWGGMTSFGADSVAKVDGALYDLETDTWRPLPSAPGGQQSEAVVAWTGFEVIVCCDYIAGLDAAAIAYNPDTNSWRELPPPPLAGARSGLASVWIDERFIVIGGNEMVAYTPATGAWEVLTPPPVELTVSPPLSVVAVDEELVVWPRPSARSRRSGLVYDLATDTWSEVPGPPQHAWPAVADVAWTGRELIIVGGLPGATADNSERLVGSRLNWATKEWTPLPDVWPEPISSEGNLGSQSILWTGEVLVVVSGALGTGVDPVDGVVVTYNPATDQWRRLDSLHGAVRWHPPLVQVGHEVLTTAGGRLQRIAVSADAGAKVDSTGLPEAPTPLFEDISLRNVPLTLVGTNGNGADIVVLDFDLGLKTFYLDGQHHRLGSGGLTDLAMGADRSLYVWRTDGPTIRHQGGPGPWDGRSDRLVFGELSQPGEVVQTGGAERFVMPIKSSTNLWVWEGENDGGVARLVGADAITRSGVEISFSEPYRPIGVGDDGSLVVATETAVSYVKPDGRVFELGSGTVVAIAGAEVLIQRCVDGECFRHWADLVTGRGRQGGSDNRAWAAVNGPIIPGHSAPLAAAAPGNEQILVVATPATNRGGSSPVELLRVDVQTMAYDVISLPEGTQPALATWSRDGRNVVVIWGNDITVVDLATGRSSNYPDLIPDGFFVLASG